MRLPPLLGALLVALAAAVGAPRRAGAQDAPAPTAAGDAAGGSADAPVEAPRRPPIGDLALDARPPPLHVDYIQYGVGLTAEVNIDAGAACREEQPGARFEPCILGSGGGLSIRGGYRSPGPWYFGGAYEFTKMDSSNLYRLGIFQQLRAEMRYMPDTGFRAAPYFTAGIGGVAYGSEWGIETGGALIFLGAGVEVEVSRLAVVGLGFVYRPVLLAGWRDTAGYERGTAIAQFLGFEFLLELRSELGRR